MAENLSQINPVEQFSRYMRARFPVIVLVSHEENRVQRALQPMLADRKRVLYTWSITSGIVHKPLAGIDAPRAFDAAMTRDPQAALRKILEYPRDEDTQPTVFLLRDLHPYMKDPTVQRLLRDVVAAFEVGSHTLALISPTWSTPADLEKSIVEIDWPLPTSAELTAILEKVERSVNEKAIPVTLNGNRLAVVEAMLGLTAFEAESTLLNAIIATGELGSSVIPVIVREKRQIIKKSGVLEFFDTATTMSDVGGLDRLKEYAKIKRATFSPKARAANIEPANAMLLLGIPGVGKSLSAKAMAGGVMPLLRLDVGAVMGQFVGQSEANMRQALKTAEAIAPCILWLDEMDKALASGGGENDGGTSTRVLGTFLTWMQEKSKPVFVIVTANDVRALKPELLRRFDDILFCDLPCRADRAAVAAIHLARRGENPAAFNIEALAGATWGFTGAEIEKVVRSARERCFVEDRPLTDDDLILAASTIVPISVTMRNQIADLREWARDRAISAAMPLETQETATGVRSLEL